MCYLSLVFSFTSQISLSWFKSCKIKVHGSFFGALHEKHEDAVLEHHMGDLWEALQCP